MTHYFSFLLFFIISTFVFAQNLDKSKLDAYFDALEQNDKFMGSLAISQNGKVIYTRSLGYSDFEKNKKADADTKYRIGSISKTFTAVLVLKAIENNKLELDQTLDKYFPEIKNAEKITIKQLLGHRSGIHNFTDDDDFLSWNTQPKTKKEMVQIILNGGSDFEPDSKTSYSNSNYVLLSYILEKIYKKTYVEILKKQILEPLGLKNTYLGGKINTEKNEAKSYRYTNEVWKAESETDSSIPIGAGAIISTASDVVKFSDALFGGKLLKKESLELMKTLKDNYGLGLFQFPFNDKKGFGHTGGIDAFSAVFAHFENGNISYALTSNGSNYNNNNISIIVLSAVYNLPFEIPKFLTYQINPEDFDQYLGIYSSSGIPLKITIFKDNNTLMAQATGQSAFPLEASEKDVFKFEPAGVVLEFNPTENTMVLKQGGGNFTFVKE